METIVDLGGLLFGGIILYLGAEWLVKGSAGLARAFGVKPLVVGLTVVAYGTSAPELAVSTSAVLKHSPDIVLSNIIGSCVANLGLILGLTSLISPPGVDGRLIKREVPVLIASVASLPLVLLDGKVTWHDSAILLGAAIAFTIFTLTVSASDRHAPSTEQLEDSAEAGGAPGGDGKLRLTVITLGGLILLIGGGELFVEGAKGLAATLGMTEWQIGATVVAIGTSLPELAASLVAAMRGHSSLAVGNVIGSNIFNIFLILGVVGFIKPIEGSLTSIGVSVWFLLGFTALGVLFMRGTRNISRVEGVLLLAGYAAFITIAAMGW